MSQVAIAGNASGTGVLTVSSPNTNSNYTLTLPAATTTLVGTDATQTLTNKTLTSPTIGGTPVMGASVITSGTAVASTSGTSIDFTGIPSWVKRVTVMFNAVSTSGTSNYLIQLGSGSADATGYNAYSARFGVSTFAGTTYTTGFGLNATAATSSINGMLIISNLSGNIWTASGSFADQASSFGISSAGSKTLSGTLDRVRITTAGGTDTFDAGSINILYE